jgi:4-amino-4-deoxy-L-arabinose transferase-like glycosyltransferase
MLAVLVRLAAIATVPAFQAPLTYEYEDIAGNILAGRGFVFPHLGNDYLSMRPVFPYLCAAVYWLAGHSHFAMQSVQALLAAATAVVALRLGHALGGPVVGGVTAVAVALDPALVYYDVSRIHPLSLHALLFVASALAIVRMIERATLSRLLWAGAIVGVASLERGTIAVLVPIGLVCWKAAGRVSWRRWLVSSALVIAVMAATAVPWLVRNIVVYGHAVVVMTAGPELLWIGNNPLATGTALGPAGRPMLEEAPSEFRERILAAGELEQQRLFRTEVLEFVRERPEAAAALWVRKFFYAWWFSPASGREHPGWAMPLYMPYYAVIAALAIAGAAVGLHRGPRAIVVMLVAGLLAVSAGQAVFFVEGRHRLVLMPVLLAFAVYGATRLAPRSSR